MHSGLQPCRALLDSCCISVVALPVVSFLADSPVHFFACRGSSVSRDAHAATSLSLEQAPVPDQEVEETVAQMQQVPLPPDPDVKHPLARSESGGSEVEAEAEAGSSTPVAEVPLEAQSPEDAAATAGAAAAAAAAARGADTVQQLAASQAAAAEALTSQPSSRQTSRLTSSLTSLQRCAGPQHCDCWQLCASPHSLHFSLKCAAPRSLSCHCLVLPDSRRGGVGGVSSASRDFAMAAMEADTEGKTRQAAAPSPGRRASVQPAAQPSVRTQQAPLGIQSSSTRECKA